MPLLHLTSGHNNPISPEWDVCIPEDALLELDVLELDWLPEGDPDLKVLRLQILTNEKKSIKRIDQSETSIT